MALSTLKAYPREASGKGGARKLRGTGRVPAVVYGHGDKPRALAVDAHELVLLMASTNVATAIISLDVEGEGTQDVLIRDVQKHPYRPDVLHVDFFHVHAGETLHLKVPVRLVGEPYGVHTEGGVLDHVLYELEVQTLPGNIPDSIEVDVSHLKIGESVRVSEIQAGEFEILNDADLPIASVVAPRVSTDEAADEETTAEPELVRTREEQDEA
jgi:large subunit ribosomal protein L25